tara:strand:- start:335 stop:475 length:141 start_codon:yes stop_codon:yes gene_type:complete
MNQSQIAESLRVLVLQYCEAQSKHDEETAAKILANIEELKRLCKDC